MATLRSIVETRIKDNVTDFKEVSGAADLRTILVNAVNTPGCYVYRERNAARPNDRLNIVSQQRTEQIGLIIVTRNVKDARGGVNADESEQLCDLIQTQLLGYEPTGYTQLGYVSGDLVLLRDGLHFWRDVYRADKTIRSI